ncbi:MAG: glycosyltransferase, partial [Actinobacteria bacterium]|nr:glycosyltransferase [Actinomycetota bacterium]
MKAKIKSTDISVIVLVYNSARTIKECLDSLVKQQLENSKYEINIIYRESTDDTFKILQQYPN